MLWKIRIFQFHFFWVTYVYLCIFFESKELFYQTLAAVGRGVEENIYLYKHFYSKISSLKGEKKIDENIRAIGLRTNLHSIFWLCWFAEASLVLSHQTCILKVPVFIQFYFCAKTFLLKHTRSWNVSGKVVSINLFFFSFFQFKLIYVLKFRLWNSKTCKYWEMKWHEIFL